MTLSVIILYIALPTNPDNLNLKLANKRRCSYDV